MREGARESCLGVLGLGPSASAQEIKAAYRDLAKVWHPDRFTHDPRLQQKAQEKLKEINDAYQRLASAAAHTPRAAGASRDYGARRDAREAREQRPPAADAGPQSAHGPRGAHAGSPTSDDAPPARRRVSRLALALPALAFCATFAFVTPRLLSTDRTTGAADDATAAPARAAELDAATADGDGVMATGDDGAAARNAREQRPHDERQHHPASQNARAEAKAEANATPFRPMATVTVSIDPTTGLRARADCPNRTAMTFPAGDEPGGYCGVVHRSTEPARAEPDAARAADKADDSRLKSFAGRLASPAKKLFGKQRAQAPDKKPDGVGASPQD